jgi:hypothetical protein
MVTSASGRAFIAAAFVVAAATFGAKAPVAQTSTAQRSRITIPFLANATKPTSLEFEGAECDVDPSGNRMTCAFQQLFMTTSPVAPDTCLVTTNRYDRVFQRDSPRHWTSSGSPEGVCGLLDMATLQDDGGVKWTLEWKKRVTKPDAAPACQTVDATPETFSWQNIRRSLPCTFVQPGGLAP